MVWELCAGQNDEVVSSPPPNRSNVLSPHLFNAPRNSLHSPPDLPLQPIRFDLTSYLTNPRGDRSRGRRLRGDGASGQKGTHGLGDKREGRGGGAGAVGDDAHSAQ